MRNLKLTIEMLPKGAWNNDFSKTLPKKEWDILRNECYRRANKKCQICGFETTELDAHEVWEFDVNNKTQTLQDIIAICSKCHGVKHIRNSQRLGYGEEAKNHFINVNKCTELDYASHLALVQMKFEERNKIYRWKIFADLSKFGLKGATIKERNIPLIKNPYQDVEWDNFYFIKLNNEKLFHIAKYKNYWDAPYILSVDVDNYQGAIKIVCNDANKIEWYLNNRKIKIKYNVVGEFRTSFNVESLENGDLSFVLKGEGGETRSKTFELFKSEVI